MMMIKQQLRGQRILFESGAAGTHLVDEVARLESTRPMLIASPSASSFVSAVSTRLTPAEVFSEIRQHVPIESVHAATAIARHAGIDLLVSIGGGSATGLAKAVALDTGLPIIAVPTTYAGSEATNVWGTTEGSRKTTGVDERVLPKTIIYDPELSSSLSLALSISSGLNAIAHCVDSMWAPHSTSRCRDLATEGIRSLAQGLPLVQANLSNAAGRELSLYGSYLSASAFACAGSGLHHKICHVLGGKFGLPHAETHAIVLPHVLAFNAPAAPEATRRISDALMSHTATSGLARLYDTLDPPRALMDFGLAERELDNAAREIHAIFPPSNPRPATLSDLKSLLYAAWAGLAPENDRRLHAKGKES